jgi:hypothetical protein
LDNIIVFLELSFLTLFVWGSIAHISTYFELRGMMSQEQLKGFNFATYLTNEIKLFFTGKGIW